MFLILERGGKVHAKNMVSNSHKCAAMRTRTYEYRVKIEATDRHLSPEGYLLNNEHVASYFEGTFGVKAPRWDAMSCENMALKAAREICKMLLDQGVDCECVTVQILGSNGAWITAKCKPEHLN